MKYDSVIFDVDSTLTTIEGLDFMASLKGKGQELQELTKKAMGGNLPHLEAMKIKMQAIAPSYTDLTNMGNAYVENITKGAKETVGILKKNGVEVWIVTGNFQPGVGVLADYLGINPENVITNTIFFDENQNYLGFDIEHPLSGNGGKLKIMNKYKKKMKRSVFVGDGSTDLEVKESVNLFIGFGGVVQRPKVAEEAEVYITEADMQAILPYIFDKAVLQ